MFAAGAFIEAVPGIILHIILIPILVMMLVPSLTTNILWTGCINGSQPCIQINLGYVIALVLFLVASFSDFLDGYLARKWNVVSTFGKIFDPIADKILINTIMIVLVANHQVFIIPVILMIVRDIIVDAFRMYAISNKIDVAADIFGKIKTVVQMAAIIFVLLLSVTPASLFPATSDSWYYWGVQNLLFYIATICSMYSLVNYALKIFKHPSSKEAINK